MCGVSAEVLLARATLNRVTEPASIPVWDLVRAEGPVEAVRALRAGTVAAARSDALRDRLAAVDPEADLAAAERHGLRLVVPESEEWPHFAFGCLERTGAGRFETYKTGLRSHSEAGEPIPPMALWVRGPLELASLGVRSVAIVGARAATAYGVRVAADLAFGLATEGFSVVSGGAFGIDAAAHRGALGAGGATVLVSAGGLDKPYPTANARLFEQVAETGLLISESPPGAAPARRRFLTRNRIIAALGTGTVVVEAARRSGAGNTAGHCGRLGRIVMAVPGPVSSVMSTGCHDLLRGEPPSAVLVTNVADVLELIGSSSDLGQPSAHGTGSGDPTAPGGGIDERRRKLDLVDEPARRVYDGFPARRVVQPDDIALSSGMSTLDVIRALPMLELSGLVEAAEGGFRIAREPRRRGATPARG